MAQLVVYLLVTLLSCQFVHPKYVIDTNLELVDGITDDIMDYVKEMVESAKQMITNITDSLKNLANDFREKIEETLANIPITILIDQLKKEIASTVANGAGSLAKKCRKEADAQVTALTSTSSSQSQACISAPYLVLSQLQDNLKMLADNARDALDQFVVHVVNCAQNNVWSPIELIKCLQTQVELFKQNVNDIQQQVDIAIETAKTNMKESVYTLADCMNNVQMETIRNGQNILAQTELCIAGGK